MNAELRRLNEDLYSLSVYDKGVKDMRKAIFARLRAMNLEEVTAIGPEALECWKKVLKGYPSDLTNTKLASIHKELNPDL